MGDVRADERLNDDGDVGVVSKDIYIGTGAQLAQLWTLDACTPASRWTLAVSAQQACTITWRLSFGDSADVLPYVVNGTTTITSAQINKRVAAAWINTGLMRFVRFEAAQSIAQNGQQIGVRLTWDRQSVTIGNTALPGTVI